MISNKQIKIFNKLYDEFLIEYNKVSGDKPKSCKIKKAETLETYKKEVDDDLDNFLNCKESSLEKISLLQKTGIDIINVKINWRFLHNLYFITDKTKDQDILNKSKEAIAANLVSKDNFLGDLVHDLSGDIKKSLEGKDLSKLNPALLMNSLLLGEKTVGGIDFADIIARTTAALKLKVDSGEIDINKLKSVSNNIKSALE
jgi:hypothetical protein